MIREQRDEDVYKSIPLLTRVLIRVIIYLMNILNKRLRIFNMSPRFSIYDNSPEIEHDDEKEEMSDEDILQ